MENSTYDSMTNLRDRKTFFSDVGTYAAARNHAHILYLQLAQLNRVNRKYNVQVGDKLLCTIARYLEGLDAEYTAYRISNSRFMLLGSECSREQAGELTKRIYERFLEVWPIEQGGKEYRVATKPLIIHMFLEPEDSETVLLDKINYVRSVLPSKGKDGVAFFDEEINADMQHGKYIMEEIRYAIEHKTFQMYYQPIYDCREKRFVSAESLIRLFGRDGSFISPGEFIPMAENSGLIDAISWIVLEKVCGFLGAHPELPLKTISVNMTGQQILDPTFPGRIAGSLEKYAVDGSRLRVEITERTIIEDFEEIKKVMEQLAGKGVQFYLDDFGTGYSNLSSMLSLPFEVIKFDQSIVRTMNESEKALKTIGLLADIMHENDYCVVAEGIETASQAQTAHEQQLDRIQGFYYAKPLPEEQLLEFLKENMQ